MQVVCECNRTKVQVKGGRLVSAAMDKVSQGRIALAIAIRQFGCPACGEGLRATFGHEPVNPGPFGTGVVCALAAP